MTPTGEREEPELPLDEIISNIRAGRRIAVIPCGRLQAWEKLEALSRRVADLDEGDLVVQRAVGRILDPTSGGQVVLADPRKLRGATIDVAYVSALHTMQTAQELVPALAPVNGEIVWWAR